MKLAAVFCSAAVFAAFILPERSVAEGARDLAALRGGNAQVKALPLILGARYGAEESSFVEGAAGCAPLHGIFGDCLRQLGKLGLVPVKHLLYVDSLTITGNYYLSKSEILRTALTGRERWLWQLEPITLSARLETHPWIKQAIVHWRPFPAAAQIVVEEERPWLVAEFAGTSWLVGRSGELLQPLASIADSELVVRTLQLPRLRFPESVIARASDVSVFDIHFAEAMRALTFFEMAGGFPFEVEEYLLLEEGGIRVLVDESLENETTGGTEVLIAADSLDTAAEVLERLRSVTADLKSRGERARRLDLRFEGQAVVRLFSEDMAAMKKEQAAKR